MRKYMFKPSLQPTAHRPLFASEVHPEGKPKAKNTMPKSLNSYEVIREKVTTKMHEKMPKPEQPKATKKKLLNF
jgi:hypothetical protein